MKPFLAWLQAYTDDFFSSTEGQGRSSTKLVYVLAAGGAVLSAVAMTLSASFVAVFIVVAPFIAALFDKTAPVVMDGAFWPVFFGCLGALWVAIFGFSASTKKNAAEASRDVAIAAMPQPPAAPESPTVVTTELKASKTTTSKGKPEAEEVK